MLKAVPPLEWPTSQELIYCAAGQRVLAIQREADAAAAQRHRELAATCQRLSKSHGHLTSPQLLSCAEGVRALAAQDEKDAETRRNPTQRKIPLEAAQVYRELAAKLERIASRV